MAEAICLWDAKAELGEGIFWHAGEQAAFWVDIYGSNLHRIDLEGGKRSWHLPGLISAAVPCASGGLIAIFQSGVSHVNLEDGSVSLLQSLEQDIPDNRFNDGCSDGLGQLWFGSMDDKQENTSGRFYCMSANGQIEGQDKFGQCIITNGPAVDCESKVLYFTDTVAGKIYRAELADDGSPSDPRLHIDFASQPGHPDGMCCDTYGGLWIAQFSGHRLTRFDAQGVEDFYIELPVPNITKCAFGGTDMKTLYITTARVGLEEDGLSEFPQSGGLFSVNVNYQGVAMPPVNRPPATQ